MSISEMDGRGFYVGHCHFGVTAYYCPMQTLWRLIQSFCVYVSLSAFHLKCPCIFGVGVCVFLKISSRKIVVWLLENLVAYGCIYVFSFDAKQNTRSRHSGASKPAGFTNVVCKWHGITSIHLHKKRSGFSA